VAAGLRLSLGRSRNMLSIDGVRNWEQPPAESISYPLDSIDAEKAAVRKYAKRIYEEEYACLCRRNKER